MVVGATSGYEHTPRAGKRPKYTIISDLENFKYYHIILYTNTTLFAKLIHLESGNTPIYTLTREPLRKDKHYTSSPHLIYYIHTP